MKDRQITVAETEDYSNSHERDVRYGEVVVINPPLYSHGGRLSLGQLTSVTLVDVTYRYFQGISAEMKYASSAYNSQGKPVESHVGSTDDLIQFTEQARAKTVESAQQIDVEREKLGMAKTGVEFIDTQEASHAVVQQRFLDLYKKGFVYREGHNFFLDTGLILRTFDVREILNAVEFRPSNLVNTLHQLLTDATDRVPLTKDRLFATPLPLYICDGCSADFIPEATTFPNDPRLTPECCPHCNNAVTNTPRDTIAPLFDLTQQRSFLSDNPEAKVIQICGRNVLTNYIYYSLLVNVALDSKAPFDVLITHGYLNDHTGKRMSRRNNNMVYVDELLENYHPDAIRYAAVKALTQNDSSSNYDESQLKAGQKFVYKIGNLRKFLKSNDVHLSNYDHDKDFWESYTVLMEKFDYKHAFSLAEAYLSKISSDIAHEREQGAIDIKDKAIRYITAIMMLQPFMPSITEKSITELI